MMQEMITTEGDSTGFVTVSSGSAAVKTLKTLTYAVFTAASVADLKVALTAAAISVYSYICNQTGHTPIANGGNYVQCNVKFNKYVRLTYVKENGSYHIGAKTEQIELIRLVTRTHTAYQKSSSVIAFDDIEIDRASSKLFASSHFNSADSVAISHYLSPTPYEEIVYVSLGSVRRSLQ